MAELSPDTPCLTALLDSATTSHIIINRSYFVDITPEDYPSVRTVNQGEWTTFGWATCVTDITICRLELQMEFELHSCHVGFLGYHVSVKGYWVRNVTNGTFFMARDVIFDENPPSLMDSDSDTSNEATGMEPDPIPVSLSTEHNPMPQLCCSNCIRNLTEKGKVYHNGIAITKSHSTKWVPGAQVEGVSEEKLTSLKSIKPNEDVPEVVSNIIIKEQAHLTIHSDNLKHYDLNTPNYNLKITPATYDKDEWLKAMQTELNTMRKMNVYWITELLAGCKAIGCRWVFKFKDDNKGSPVYKVQLVAQGFSQDSGSRL